jgi:hypothetical protein
MSTVQSTMQESLKSIRNGNNNIVKLERMNCLIEQSNKLMDMINANKEEVNKLRQEMVE